MRKRIALWLVRLARKIYPQKDFSLSKSYEPKVLSIGYKITKDDVREYCKKMDKESYRSALKSMVEDTKKEIANNIFAGIHKNNLIKYEVSKGLFEASVIGKLYVYENKDEIE